MVTLSLWIRLEREENPPLCLKWQQSARERSLFQRQLLRRALQEKPLRVKPKGARTGIPTQVPEASSLRRTGDPSSRNSAKKRA